MLSRDNEFPLLHLESPGREVRIGDCRDEVAVMTTGDISIPGVGEESEQGASLKKDWSHSNFVPLPHVNAIII